MSDDDSDRVVPDRDTTDVVGARIAAQVVDTVALFVQLVAVTVLLGALVRPSTETGVEGLAFLALFTLPLYGGLLEGFWNGQTLGKRLLGIRVVDRRGRDPGVGAAFLRNVPAVVLFSWVTTAVALAAIATGDRRQRVFDGVAGTHVVDATGGRGGARR
ncbi:RDD family protein [Halosegnis marinus]|uniref:RDD family protein n=1 Tax=Halosegnis marinus TaxID=3034023 RepID=A0ABD5ZLZ7_9EURY|nr:RDD family protein [Halosegnis sp. DT85]